MINLANSNMDPSTFWKVLWLISFCIIFNVIVISLSFWLILQNSKIKNLFMTKWDMIM